MVAVNTKVIYLFEVIFKEIFLQWVQHDFVVRDFYLLTAMEKISRNGHFNDLSNESKIISLVNYICSKKNFQCKKKDF